MENLAQCFLIVCTEVSILTTSGLLMSVIFILYVGRKSKKTWFLVIKASLNYKIVCINNH